MKVGTDIVEIARFEAIDELVLKKMFHPTELENRRPQHLAGVLAAKESLMKIFQGSSFLDFEMIKERTGKPRVITTYPFTGDISISHDGEYAIAVAMQED